MSVTPTQVAQALNTLRQSPSSYIPLLEQQLKYFEGNLLKLPGEIPLRTNEGPKAVQECIAALKAQAPLKPLQLVDGLSAAAADHANDIGPKGISGHTGSDGSSMSCRIERHGEWMGNIGENISFGAKDQGQDIILQLIIDDGVLSRGHRKNCLSPNFNFVGIGLANHKTYKSCCVLDFAGEFTKKGQSGGFNQPPTQHSHGFNQPPAQHSHGFSQPSAQYSTGFSQPSTEYSTGFSQPPTSQGFNQPPGFQNQMQFQNPNQFAHGTGYDQPPQHGSHQMQMQQMGGGGNDMPPGCVGKSTSVQTQIAGNKKTVTTVTKYTMQDGSTREETKTEVTMN